MASADVVVTGVGTPLPPATAVGESWGGGGGDTFRSIWGSASSRPHHTSGRRASEQKIRSNTVQINEKEKATTQLLCVSGFLGAAELPRGRSGAAQHSRSRGSRNRGRRGAGAEPHQSHGGSRHCRPRSTVFNVVAFATAALSAAAFVTVALSATTLSIAAFTTTTLSATTFVATTSSAALADVVSFVVLVLTVTATTADTSLAVEADPPSAVDAATLESGCGAVAAPGACCPDSGDPLTVDPPL
jgi:hypothetical protein